MNAYVGICFTITLLCCAHAAPNSRDVTQRKIHTQDLENVYGVIGGIKSRADIKDYPYTASVIIRTGHEGSAVIINRKWLLTTGWVVLYELPQTILVRAGNNSAITGGQTSWVKKVVAHPKYIGDWAYDLALLKLKKPLKFNKYVKPIKIAHSSPPYQATATLTGFGLTNTSQQFRYIHDGWLRKSNMSVIPFNKCQSYYKEYTMSFTKYSFCTNVTELNGPCFYDYGSPLVYKNQLVGLYSGPPTCADPAYPAIYTDVTKLRSWISDTIRHHSKTGESADL